LTKVLNKDIQVQYMDKHIKIY